MFRRSCRPKKPGERDAKEGAEQPEGDGEACAILQADESLSAAPPCNKVTPEESGDCEERPDHFNEPFSFACCRRAQWPQIAHEVRISMRSAQSPMRA